MLTQRPALTVDNTRRPWRYMLGSTGLWGVTDVLRDHGFINPEWCSEVARERGRAVHLATAYADQGRLEWNSLHQALHGYVHGWQDMNRRMGWRVLDCEVPRHHAVYGFGGQLDRRMADPAGTEWVVDIKTVGPGGSAPKSAAYQTAAYDLLLPRVPPGARARRRAAVELHPDGKARLVEHTDFADAGFFLAFLSTTKRRHHHGVIDGPAA